MYSNLKYIFKKTKKKTEEKPIEICLLSSLAQP